MSRRTTVVAAACAFALGAATLTSAAAPIIGEAAHVSDRAQRVAAPTTTSAVDAARRLADEMVEIVNAERSARGLAPFATDSRVTAAAVAHATDMAAMGSMQHTGSDGSNAGDRLEREGFTWSAWGENVAAGFVDAGVLFDVWYSSPQHRQHMFADLRYVGVGVATSTDGVSYWALVVASGR